MKIYLTQFYFNLKSWPTILLNNSTNCLLSELILFNIEQQTLKQNFSTNYFSFKPFKMDKEKLLEALMNFMDNQDYEKAYKALTSWDWFPRYMQSKSLNQQTTFKEHVSMTWLFYSIKC